MNLLKFVVIFAVFGVTFGLLGNLIGDVVSLVTGLLGLGSGNSGSGGTSGTGGTGGTGGTSAVYLDGTDENSDNGDILWQYLKDRGNHFAYLRATGGVNFTDDLFKSYYQGSAAVGLYRGGYHLGEPNQSSATAQVKYLLSNGGRWSADGKTLPAALQLQPQPTGDTCYNMSTTAMVAWIKEFSDTYEKATRRKPVIYTSLDWWKQCTGNSVAFKNNPLWIQSYADSTGTLPGGWNVYTFWQYVSFGAFGVDKFNGDESQLKKFVYNLKY